MKITTISGIAMMVASVAAASAAELRDKSDVKIVPADSRRIVSIGGAITEIIYRLKAEKQLVAIDTTSRFPARALKRLPNVGYLRALSAEGVLSQKPTLIIADAAAGPPTALRLLRRGGVQLTVLREDFSPAGIVYKIRAVARLLNRDAAGDVLARTFETDMAGLKLAIDQVKRRPKVLFVLGIGRGTLLAAGQKTSADMIIRLAGGQNAIRGYTGYKPLSPEAAIAARPDVILTMQRTVKRLGSTKAVAARRELAVTPAGKAGRVVAMDGLLLLGFGPRTPIAVRRLAGYLHPGLSLPALGIENAKQ